MTRREQHAPLVIIGGAEEKEGACRILREVVRLAGGDQARIVVMTLASAYPDEVGTKYVEVFRQLGVRTAEAVDARRRQDVDARQALRAVEQASALFFTGGDQLHVTSLIGGSRMHQLMMERYEAGMLVAGTSAGAAMMSNTMILRGRPQESPRCRSVDLGPGMNFLPGTIIDTHFTVRGRNGRLVAAVTHFPYQIGLGVDENTAMVVIDNQFEVIGEGAVTVVDAAGVTYTNMPDVEGDASLALFDITLHVLPAGYGFDFHSRRPFLHRNQQSAPERVKIATNSNGARSP